MKSSYLSLSLLSALLCSQPVAAICDAKYTSIAAIQGSGDSSPLLAQQLITQGVVTAVVYPGSQAAGIMLRATQADSTAAAAGLFIADREAAAIYRPGQLLQVSGTVAEINQLTSLAQVSEIKLCGETTTVQPVVLRLPLPAEQSWERLEGTLLRFEQTLTVNDTYSLGRYGEITLADKRLLITTEMMAPGKEAATLSAVQQHRHMLVLDDGSDQQNPDPVHFGETLLTATNTLRVGDTVSKIEGVLLQDERGYRLLPTQKPHFHAANPRPAAPQAKPAKALRIASFNVLNYFNGSGQSPAFPTRRGATSPAELARQQAKIVSALVAMDADIIGLLEVENNGYSQQGALANLTVALNKVAAKPYRFIITTEQPGSDAIKVALLYRPSAVSVEGKAAMLLAKPFDWGSRPPLAQSFRHLASNKLVTVSINHFKSKGSCPKDITDANADQQDGQACWNALRVSSAKALSDWLATQPTGVSTDKQLILGDLNAYRLEDPVTALEQRNWHYLSAADGSQYSYVYRGRTGSLDHALASPALAAQLHNMQHWAINADEPVLLDYNVEFKNDSQQQQLYAPTPYRSSDHDPLIATFQF
ncbi:ExeM/NucH family extracellular endonuclease [Rheinheimera sp.]|uniref:ExeM/NucH family extracellular endonuclease n=1 Tax=Rheinheimera sp. TaxID=1869214 RepID=UPI002736896A|nr:ExeM/NucH family extracellular endonuclease [Rheinheimera sp.]MDP2714663.1 ExeM/NucH family extracellular endonuclease [Rheinheimera sp.]